MSKSSEDMRVNWKKWDTLRDEGLTTPDDITRFDDIVYGEDAIWNLLDVYKPKDKVDQKLPVIVSVHGGGWVYGDKGLYQFYCMNLAQRGFAVVNYSYRLAPENRFPAALEDSARVVEWIFAKAEKYGLDTNNIFLIGDSAGAQLAGQLCALTYNQTFASHFDFGVPNGLSIKGVVMNCGCYQIYDFEHDCYAPGVMQDLMEDLFEDGGSADEFHLMNVPEWVNENFPPAFIVSCLGDMVRAQLPIFVAAYEKAGVPMTAKIYGDKENPLFHVFMVNIREEMSHTCTDEECAFFQSLVKGV